jgi:hypothetical protein
LTQLRFVGNRAPFPNQGTPRNMVDVGEKWGEKVKKNKKQGKKKSRVKKR